MRAGRSAASAPPARRAHLNGSLMALKPSSCSCRSTSRKSVATSLPPAQSPSTAPWPLLKPNLRSRAQPATSRSGGGGRRRLDKSPSCHAPLCAKHTDTGSPVDCLDGDGLPRLGVGHLAARKPDGRRRLAPRRLGCGRGGARAAGAASARPWVWWRRPRKRAAGGGSERRSARRALPYVGDEHEAYT